MKHETKLKNALATTYSPTSYINAVLSAQEDLTAVFGMGTGVPPPLLSPRQLFNFSIDNENPQYEE